MIWSNTYPIFFASLEGTIFFAYGYMWKVQFLEGIFLIDYEDLSFIVIKTQKILGHPHPDYFNYIFNLSYGKVSLIKFKIA